jgi:hypothetical protein
MGGVDDELDLAWSPDKGDFPAATNSLRATR